ncbi:MAG: hypothetical protein GY945_11580 [Rhodobacteraceae bacterium]|nr:hypothetical protein [Paracoccaceae bacterium]
MGGAMRIVFDPALPGPLLGLVAAGIVLLVALAIWRGLAGWTARALAAGVLLLALAGPSVQEEERETLSDILLLVVDQTASQSLPGRGAQTARALEVIKAQVGTRDTLELHLVALQDGPDDRGTRLESAINQALSDLPRDRLAGIIAVSDGLVHDVGTLAQAPPLPAPLHLLLTGNAADWDRRLTIKSAPAFAILGEEQAIILRVEDLGAVPASAGSRTQISISIDGAAPSLHNVPIGQNLKLPVVLEHGGQNVIRLALDEAASELTTRNNAAIVQINGVRDRLRVLLVSGQPHPGTRTWRNLLKSDASVDLVHFTILRPPEKQDGVPVSELSLIAFPTQELFLEKVDEFDLIIFDRYELRGILPSSYLASVRDYVKNGGAVLVAAGPGFATAGSLARSPLGEILPALPTSRVSEAAFAPQVTDIGQRHPVTQGLEQPNATWGRWLRQIELAPVSGHVVMKGIDDTPLLVLDRVDEGRVALLASDHAWLWSRGFEGGGPQLELLRRLAHWMMKEPELEEEALTAEIRGGKMQIIRHSLGDGAREVEVTLPDGSTKMILLEETAPGHFEAGFDGTEMGLYRLKDDTLNAVVALGPASPREFDETIATGERLAPVIADLRGGVFALENGMPSLRFVNAGRPAAGRGWLGLNERAAFLTLDLRVAPLLPAWLALLFAAALSIWGWLREGQR